MKASCFGKPANARGVGGGNGPKGLGKPAVSQTPYPHDFNLPNPIGGSAEEEATVDEQPAGGGQ